MNRVRVIVDANQLSALFSADCGVDLRPLLYAIAGPSPTCVMVVGGHLVDEIQKVRTAWLAVVELERAGRVWRETAESVATEHKMVAAIAHVRSDDEHVLALARAAHARVLASCDNDLCADFKDTTIVPPPQGRIYRKCSHAHLLRPSKR